MTFSIKKLTRSTNGNELSDLLKAEWKKSMLL